MNVLLLSSRGSVSDPIANILMRLGHLVLRASNLYEATDYWNERPVDCVIMGLNMDPAGLTDKQIYDTYGGLLTGWIWLKTRVLCDDSFNYDMRYNTIIYSAYADELMRLVPKKELVGLRFVTKTLNLSDDMDGIMGCSESICKEGNHVKTS